MRTLVMAHFNPLLRSLSKQPGFVFLAVLTLALGIGVNVGIFSALEALVLNPLPYPDSHRLVAIYEDASFIGYAKNTPAPANFYDWKREAKLFEDMAATSGCRAILTGGSRPEEIKCRNVTPNLLPLLGIRPQLGRWLQDADDFPNPNSVLISDGLWQRRFGADPNIVGQSIQMNGRAVTVAGVMPEVFRFPVADVEMWVPLGLTPQRKATRGSHFLTCYGRLKPGVTLDQAQTELKAIQKRINLKDPGNTDPRESVTIETLREQLLGKMRLALWVLMGAAAMVLLIACANVANLLLTRATGRQRELAIRSALGASTGELIKVIFAETIVLSVAGAIAGIALAWVSRNALEGLVPQSLEGAVKIQLDTRVLAFALLMGFLTAILASLTPLFHVLGSPLVNLLRQDSKASSARSTVRLRNILIVAEVALTVALLSGAGLMTRSLFAIWNTPLGFDPASLYVVRVSQPSPKYDDITKRELFYTQSLAKIRALPGIFAASYAATPPFYSVGNSNGYAIEGKTAAGQNEPGDMLVRNGNHTYLQTIGATLREGRHFTAADRQGSELVVIVNESFGRKIFNGQSPIGRRIALSPLIPPVWRRIVGVVGEIRERGYDLEPKAVTYTPSAQMEIWTASSLMVRGANVPNSLNGIRAAIQSADPDQPMGEVRSFNQVLAIDQASRRQQMFLLAAFSGLSLLLACLGIYAILSYTIELRRNELGVRMALGATGADLMRLIVGQGMRLALAGLAIGLAGALAMGRWLESSLYGVKAYDPLTLGGVCGLLLTVSLLACLIPARRAAKQRYFWQLAQ